MTRKTLSEEEIKSKIQLYFRMPCHLLHPIQENIGRCRSAQYGYEAHQRRLSLFHSRIHAALYVASTF